MSHVAARACISIEKSFVQRLHCFNNGEGIKLFVKDCWFPCSFVLSDRKSLDTQFKVKYTEEIKQ